jgi:Rrf2 family protein
VLLSHTSTYAVGAAIHLAEQEDDTPVSVGRIAAALGVPRNYLSKILHQLARDGVLVSQRGPRGGFRLATAPEDTRISDIIDAVEPLWIDRRCLLGRPECNDDDPCLAHHRWQPLAGRIVDFLNETTLADLRRRPRRANSALTEPRRPAVRRAETGGKP